MTAANVSGWLFGEDPPMYVQYMKIGEAANDYLRGYLSIARYSMLYVEIEMGRGRGAKLKCLGCRALARKDDEHMFGIPRHYMRLRH